MINIYSYQDYRAYLREVLDALKKSSKGYSHRAIQMKMGIRSSGFLSNIIAGRANLTLSQTAKLSKILKHSRSEAAYFEKMVLFTNAKSLDDKTDYFNRMLSLQKTRLKVLTGAQLSLFSRWHYTVIRELAGMIDISDYRAVGAMIDPPITAAEVEESVENMIALGILEKRPDGAIRPVDDIVTSGDEVRSFDIVQFQAATLDTAKRALLQCPPSQRDISVLTFSASEQCLQQIKGEIRGLRKKILSMVEKDTASDRVFQCSINFFPVSKKKRTV